MKFIKVSLLIVTAFILVILLIGGVFLASLDTGKYTAIITEQVKQRTGRDMSVGDIKLSFFPWLGIELEQLTLSNAIGFKPQYMVEIASLDVHLQLIALLKRQIKVDTLQIHGLQLALGKNKKSATNWDDILQKLQSKEAKTGEQSLQEENDKAKSEETPASTMAIMINGIELKDATIHWRDDSAGQSVSLQRLNLTTGAFYPGQPLPIKLSTDIKLPEPQTSPQSWTRIRLELKTTAEFEPKTQQLKLDQLVMNIDTALQKKDIEQAGLTLKTTLQADLKNQVFELPQMALTLNARGKAIPAGSIRADIKSAVKLNLQQQTVELKKLTINSSGVTIQTHISVIKLLDAPQLTGQLMVEEFNPMVLAKKLAIDLPKTQTEDALKKISLSLDFRANEHSVELKKINLQLDQSALTGELSMRQFTPLDIRYQLQLDKINLDNYLPPAAAPSIAPTASRPAKGGSVAGGADTPIDLPVELLRSVNIQGDFKAADITVYKQKISAFTIQTRAKKGLIKLPVIRAHALDGKINASAQLDVRKQPPEYKLQIKAANVNADKVVSPMLENILGQKSLRLMGEANINLNVYSKGISVNQLISSSNGQLKLNIGKATLQGVDAEYFALGKVFKYMQNKKLPVPDKWKKDYSPKDMSALKMARASARLNNGVLENQDLLLLASRFKISGAGKVNLLTEKINYRLIVDINQLKPKTTIERLLDVPIPVIVKGRGRGAQLNIDIDYDQWLKSIDGELKAEAKKEIKKAVKKQQKKQKEKLKNKLDDKLRRWLK